MQTVYKYLVPLSRTTTVNLPQGAKVLKFGEQHGSLYLWAFVNPEAPLHQVHYEIRGTGTGDVGDVGRYLDTVQAGEYVWHIFESWQ